MIRFEPQALRPRVGLLHLPGHNMPPLKENS